LLKERKKLNKKIKKNTKNFLKNTGQVCFLMNEEQLIREMHEK